MGISRCMQVGFVLVDELARRQGTRVDKLQANAAVGRAQLEGRRLLLAKPLTFMNASGESVGKLARYYKVPARHSFSLCTCCMQVVLLSPYNGPCNHIFSQRLLPERVSHP